MGTYRKETEKNDNKKTEQLISGYPDVIRSFLISIESTTTPKTRLEYAKDICRFMDYAADVWESPVTVDTLRKVKKNDIEEYQHYLRMYEKDGKVYTNSEASVKRKLASLRSFWSYLYDSDFLPENIMQKVKSSKLRDHEIIRMDQKETAAFVATALSGGKMSNHQAAYHDKQSVRDLAMIYLMLSTGIRVSECVGLDIQDIDTENYCIHITRKGGKESVIWYSDQAAEYLQDYLTVRKKMDVDTTALFLSSRKTRISVRTVEVVIQKYAKQAVPMKHITPHKLRATYATNLYEETGDIYLVGEILGHADISTTKKHYAHLSEKRKEQARNRVTITEDSV